MAAVIDKELSVRKLGISLTPQERLEVFGSTSGRSRRQGRAEPRRHYGVAAAAAHVRLYLAQYCHDAIIANCQRAAAGQDHPATRQARR